MTTCGCRVSPGPCSVSTCWKTTGAWWEIPGLDKDDFKIEVVDDALVVSGEKRFERDSSDGRWRTIQCAYGAFRRVVPLPAPVRADQAKASYRNGVLRVELPKVEPGPVRSVTIDVQ